MLFIQSRAFRLRAAPRFLAETRYPLAQRHKFTRWTMGAGSIVKKTLSFRLKPWPQAVLKYLGRYTHRIAISNSRIVAMNDKTVSFVWKDYAGGNQQKTMTLSIGEFIRRFLLHVIPNCFVRIRHYGFLSNRGKKDKLKLCSKILGIKPVIVEREEKNKSRHWYDIFIRLTGKDPTLCPVCAIGHMKTYREIPHGSLSLEDAMAA